jgi:uncharacterized protein (DUF1330 family)
MSAYVISEVEVLDESQAAKYRELAAASIAAYGGVYRARAVTPDVVEGEFPPTRRVVIVEFPSIGRAREWYSSPEYAEARAIVDRALDRRLIFVAGEGDGVSSAE